jgi:hypothetical protein
MERMRRFFTNVFGSWFVLRRRFPPALLDEIAAAIARGERTHLGEVCVAIESRLAPLAVLGGLDAATRAHEVFSQLRVWDTEHNNGVLFYVSLAEHRIEIVADRGIAARVTSAEWGAICARMRECFAAGQWRTGSLDGIAAAHALLRQHFPADDDASRGELSDRPVLL